MKTKELIAQLQKEDPTGETEVCVGNISVSFVHREPAYWDGILQVIVRDEKGYAVSGKYKRQGEKIQIDTLDFYTLLWDHPEAEIDYSELDGERKKSFKANHDKLRKEVLDFEYKLEIETFTDFVKEQILYIGDIPDTLGLTAKRFFDENLSVNDKIPEDIPIIGESYVTRRKKQWSRQVEVTYDGVSGLKIKKV